ncbi:arylsulfatase A-like enzyme [Primorskyibacter sedentarius]|uniref:Arylsulfatase A-like enzyme n=1 Tax=Primorskyibacter sedentarius TaxID=745311 RepID=A0A4R3J4E9_9RHOB|nr:sulfatase [Primorskyibacter sedentarius]TCS59733.1 arylsulfatase A-like enzyme [Primorskyibacter sedentarius]
MKTVLVLFDSLNRRAISPYGGNAVPTPNFDRLAERSARFDGHHVGSMPCMPARRDLMTGRMSFLHRSWGPIEPFDVTFPEVLSRENGVYSHFVTDHFHYWEDGGATYHSRYDSHEFFRGQEGDRWKGVVAPDWPGIEKRFEPAQVSREPRSYKRHNVVNRDYLDDEAAHPSFQTFAAGLEFIDRNKAADDWFLQIETFAPHEPFFAPKRFRDIAGAREDGPALDWPEYGHSERPLEEREELRASYHAAVAMCDELLGQVLDTFDRDNLWEDTALIVTTDHGFLLGEHDLWAKNRMTLYQEIAQIPLFIHDPAHPAADGTRIAGLSQTPDLAATILDLFDGPRPAEMASPSLRPMLAGQGSPHDALIYGYFGGAVNLTDGRYSYHRYPADLAGQEIYQYTLMPTHIFDFFHPEELTQLQLASPTAFSRDMPVLRVPVSAKSAMYKTYGPGCLIEDDTRLYDLARDPGQAERLDDPALEARLAARMADLMRGLDAPAEAFARLDLARTPEMA